MNPATQPQREGTAVANSKAAPTTHSERRKFVLRTPMACRPSKEMDVKSTTEAATRAVFARDVASSKRSESSRR